MRDRCRILERISPSDSAAVSFSSELLSRMNTAGCGLVFCVRLFLISMANSVMGAP